MTFSPELLSDSEVIRLIEARNHQSLTFMEVAQSLLQQAADIGLVDHASEIVNKGLFEVRSNPAYSLVEAAQDLFRQSAEIDLSNIATEILHKYPEAATLQLLEDQRTDYKGVIFCGHLDNENGKKVDNSYDAKEFVNALVLEYEFADPNFVVERFINLREYAAKQPSWFATTSDA